MATTLSWGDVGERYYEGGVDRGVLYPPVGPGIAWNGLVQVNESIVGGDFTGIYFDGTKFAIASAISEFSGTLQAYTYPDEFLEFEGVANTGVGLHIANQEVKRFGLCYRTKIGNDIKGFDLGYRIHVLYNVMATPSDKPYQSIGENTEPITFEWKIDAIPAEIPGYRPSAHLIFDSRQMAPQFLQDIENSLYGDGISDPTLPPASILVGFTENWVVIRITDNMNGTWTAEGDDDVVFMIDGTTFQINQANTKVVDANTYMISNTTK